MRDPNKLPSGVTGRAVLAIVAAGAAIVGAATVAEAGEGRGKKHHHYYGSGYVKVPPGHVHYYAPAPFYYAPRPVVVYPAPVMYAPAYPVYGPPGGSVNLGISLPLR
ncbi:MAG: hypothetical protein Q8K93_32900 [Reyranella sp.]|uniref:hypothetical protein n=1 Tax=Reyranella sp. TaxID=1929291 RepID=UPI00272F6337|nr:hypothetical protein [Reyranella sp.]MDP1966995.1 hypothetical protein [Reyranella sp.]MDP2375178.1 hypothetical protein [Reyranella sp.]